MDIFQTTITAGAILLRFLRDCRNFSDDARRLEINFAWDLATIEAIRQYFVQRQGGGANAQLPERQQQLLNQTSEYLGELVDKIAKSLGKLSRTGLKDQVLNVALWTLRKDAIEEMQKELNEWTKRFDVRVLGLPTELRAVIPSTTSKGHGDVPAVVRVNTRMKEIKAIAESAETSKQELAKGMQAVNPDRLTSAIAKWERYLSSLPIQDEGEQLVFASRHAPEGLCTEEDRFHTLTDDMGELAAILNCLDSEAGVRLLKVLYYFYHKESRQFIFAHSPPYRVSSLITLEKRIENEPFPSTEDSLNSRLKLAHKLAEAVFFIHTAGFLHKNITTSSVIIFNPSSRRTSNTSPLVDGAFLMGFDLIRGTQSFTTKEGAVSTVGIGEQQIWDFDIFQHPHRLQGTTSPRYIKAYDVYSLGVVLLQIGLWECLRDACPELEVEPSSNWVEKLKHLAEGLSPRMGDRYRSLVEWCLSLSGDEDVKEARFVEKVLDPLEDISNVL